MKKIIVIVFFIFFCINITFGKESDTGSFYNEELTGIYKTPENKIIKDNRFDYIYNQAKKELSLGNEEKSYDLILEYLNRAGFYNCNVFKYLIQKEPSNNIYKDYLKSCKILNEEKNYKKAKEIIKKYNNYNKDDIILLYYISLNKYGEGKNLEALIKDIKNKNKFNLYIEYLKFSYKYISNKKYNFSVNIDLLKKEDYKNKKFFLYWYAKLKYKEGENYDKIISLLRKSLLYENTFIKRVQESYYLGIYKLLIDISIDRKEYMNKLIYSNLLYKELLLYKNKVDINKIDINKPRYYRFSIGNFNEFLLKQLILNFNKEEIKNKLIQDILAEFSFNDKKIVEMFYNLRNDNIGEKDIINFLNLVFCTKNTFNKSSFLLKFLKINELIIKTNIDYNSLNCKSTYLSKLKSTNNKFIINNKIIIEIILIILLFLLGIFFLNKVGKKS